MNEETIFTEALAMPSLRERHDFLDKACGGDAELRARIEVLLTAHGNAGSFLESPPTGLAIPQAENTSDVRVERPGTMVGPYKLLEQIGEGGMGVVFMAEQVHPFRRRVALKIIKPGMDTKQVIARFEAERQALALMDHPNIAKVLEAGATDAGRPYFVMELVRGIPITEYCDQQKLAPRQRLELFIQVCQAVQHAHQKGIIHRDLKPNNVLVTLADDGMPVPKVIDFGIAKATVGQRLTEHTLFTEFRQLVGTPLYMSPEQAERSAVQDVDTRSDVYSLGVLLYELLTGTTPFDKQRLGKAAYDEIRRIICEEEPPRPSTRISTLGSTLTTVSAQRQTDPRKLSTIVRGELDWIVMRALEKDRGRRYETAVGLSRDVERYLADEPVDACPPSKTYWLRKLAWRYRGLLRVAMAFGLLLLAATVVSTWEAVRATRAEAAADNQRNQALHDRARADEEAAISEGLSRFYGTEVIGQASPVQATSLGLRYDPHLTVRDALDRAADRIGNWAHANPLLEAAISERLAATYMELGDSAKACELGERSLAILRKSRGIAESETLRCMVNLANAYSAGGNCDKGEALYLEALHVSQRVLGDYDRITLLLHQNLANTYCKMGRYAEAEQHLSHSFAKGVTKPHVWQVRILVQIYVNKNEFDKAEAILLDAIRPMAKQVGEETVYTLWLKEDLARTYALQKRFPEAQALFLAVLEGYRQLSDGADTLYTSHVMSYLADLHRDQEKPENAAAWRAWVPTTAPAAPRPSREFANAIQPVLALAKAMSSQDRIADAIQYYGMAVSLQRRALGEQHPDVAATLMKLAHELRRDSKANDAEKILKEAIHIWQGPDGEESAEVGRGLSELGDVLRSQGRNKEAEELLRRAIPMLRTGRDDAALAGALHALGHVLRSVGEFKEAEAVYREGLALRRGLHPPDNNNVANSLGSLGSLFLSTRRYADAKASFQEALRLQTAERPPGDPRIAATKGVLSQALVGLEEYADAEPLLLASYDSVLAKASASNYLDRRVILDQIIELYDHWGKPDRGDFWNTKQIEADIASVTQAIEAGGKLNPNLPGLLEDRAQRYRLIGRTTEADADIAKVIRLADTEAPLALHTRARLYNRSGRFSDSLTDEMRAVQLDPTYVESWTNVATLQLYLGREPEYRAARKVLLGLLKETNRNLPARTCLFGPLDADEQKLVMPIVDRKLGPGADQSRLDFFYSDKGLAEYRSGNYEKALKWLILGRKGFAEKLANRPRELRAYGNNWDDARTTDDFAIAMCEHQLKHDVKARELLAQARDHLRNVVPSASSGIARVGSLDWQMVQIISREAEKTILGKEPTTIPSATQPATSIATPATHLTTGQ